MIIIRKWQVIFCDGNVAAAALLSFLEYWHNIKLEQSRKAIQANHTAENHGVEATQDESLWQWHTGDELEDGLMIYKKDAIRDAIKLLESKGAIITGRNPNPRFHFDKTRFFLLQPHLIMDWLKFHYGSTEKRTSYTENQQRSWENQQRSLENPQAITEITSKTTTKKQGEATPGGVSVSEYVKAYQDIWGMMVASPYIAEQIKEWEGRVTLETWKYALGEAMKGNKRTWKYLEGILNRVEVEGYTGQVKVSPSTPTEPDPDVDWAYLKDQGAFQ